MEGCPIARDQQAFEDIEEAGRDKGGEFVAARHPGAAIEEGDFFCRTANLGGMAFYLVPFEPAWKVQNSEL